MLLFDELLTYFKLCFQIWTFLFWYHNQGWTLLSFTH
jgi:hypothetical protein